ncbi:MAG: AMP-binding protein [Tetrasphaera sp.]
MTDNATAADYVWEPTPAMVDQANVTRLARAHGIDGIAALRERSVQDISWFWDAVVRDLGIVFREPYSAVVDLSRGIEFPDWFVGGTLNVLDSCLTRWARDPETATESAVVHESEDGQITTLTFAQLEAEVERVAAGLAGLGIGRGDAVALYLPMIPEAVVALYAVAKLGAMLVPLFSGFAPGAITSRVQDADAVAVIVADGTIRRRKRVAMEPPLEQAIAACPTVTHLIVIDNLHDGTEREGTERDGTEHDGADQASGTDARGEPAAYDRVRWADLGGAPVPTEAMGSDEVFALAYTSGTTGRPKGAVHTHAGFLVKTASEVAYSFDVSAGGVFCWITDMGWVMGPLSIIGTHANGATLLLYEGSPDVPDLDRLWNLVERHRVTMLGVSPTLIRTLRLTTDAERAQDLSSVHTLGSTGEPWDPDSYEWLAQGLFGGRVPIINFSGGTEVGGSFLAPYPVERIHSCSLGGPSLGMDVDVVDDAGNSIRGEVGELVCRQPWPAMTRGVWKDEERYLESYWRTFPGMWRHGDYALADETGWYIRGRSDDVMNVAGKRLAPAEVEGVMTTHPAVSEAAAIGVPDPKKGETVWAFWVPRPDATEDVSDQLRAMIAAELGNPFAPSVVCRVERLPKTRSQKIMRRAVRAAALGTDPGDLAGAENPESIEEIRAAIDSR